MNGVIILFITDCTIRSILDLKFVIDSKGKFKDFDATIFCVDTSISLRSISYCLDTVFISPIKAKNGRYVAPESYGWGLDMEKDFFDSHIYPTGSTWNKRIASGSITFLA